MGHTGINYSSSLIIKKKNISADEYGPQTTTWTVIKDKYTTFFTQN